VSGFRFPPSIAGKMLGQGGKIRITNIVRTLKMFCSIGVVERLSVCMS
jgi:hypothetical protein